MKSFKLYILGFEKEKLVKNCIAIVTILLIITIIITQSAYCIYEFWKQKTSNPHRLLLNLSEKRNLKRRDKYVDLSNFSVYYTWKTIFKKSYKNNRLKTSSPTWNGKFELLDGSYSVLSIEGIFECIIKKHETITDNPPTRKYVNEIENRRTFKIKTGY